MSVTADPAQAFWKYLIAPPVGTHDPGFARMDAAQVLFEESSCASSRRPRVRPAATSSPTTSTK